MGASESKIVTKPATNPVAPVKKTLVSHLIDPRSPSAAIDRTPIQIGRVKDDQDVIACPSVGGDPRSPTLGVVRTPVRDIMRAKVGNLARHLGMLFHTEAEGKVPHEEHGDAPPSEQPDSAEPLLSPPKSRISVSESADQNGEGASSPFVLLDEPKVEGEIEADNVSLEEAEEAQESPVHKKLSMSLITCHEGAPAPNALAELHNDAEAPRDTEAPRDGVDHLFALPPVTPEAVRGSSESPEAAKGLSAGPLRLTLSIKSPSQVVFKPQWLGKGFGTSGLRARSVQGTKGGASPLAVAVAVKNVNNENKVNSGRKKQKEGRSPLQILKETNSPRGQPQMKLKGSTPERPRLGQMDNRILAINKEN
ncbi:cell division cycle-associated protein 3 [Stigmatopora nigra]